MGIWQMTESLAELEQMYEIRASEKPTYQKFRNDRRRKEWITVRILLREMTGRDLEISYYESGRPYINGSNKNISITHTIGYVGIRIASHPVAIDMEYMSDRVLHLIPKFVTEGEMRYIRRGDEVRSALIMWSAKETLYKIFDKSELTFSDLTVEDLDTTQPTNRFKGRIKKNEFEIEAWLTYEIKDDYILVYC